MIQTASDLTHEEQIAQILHELNFPVYRIGYIQLCIGIPHFFSDFTQSLSKELYPYIAAQVGNTSTLAVEHAIREVIRAAYESCDPKVWEKFFPGERKVPSNKLFIATLAERLK